nr:alpha/beta fold hydrolase [Natronospira proteinivora]
MIQSPGPALDPGWEAGEGETLPRLEGHRLLAEDGYELPLSRWLPDSSPESVVLALHGFNDFRASHETVAHVLTRGGTAVYAYDQRGFGTTEQRGIWPGRDRLVDDARTALALLRDRYPEQPLYLLGESMGAAVAILALTGEQAPEVDGTILMAPAVWARETQPWYQRLGLWLGVRLTPGMKLDSEWVAVEPTDDPTWADYWDEHPLVIHRSRMDALDGISHLMSDALAASAELPGPTLLLYGGNDEVVPPEAICNMLKTLPDPQNHHWRFAYYPEGWHFLSRDRRARETLMDMLEWQHSPTTALPSGRELTKSAGLALLCED